MVIIVVSLPCTAYHWGSLIVLLITVVLLRYRPHVLWGALIIRFHAACTFVKIKRILFKICIKQLFFRSPVPVKSLFCWPLQQKRTLQ